MKAMMIAAGALGAQLLAPAATAQVAAEAMVIRADGDWGGEAALGYDFGGAGFRLTPMVGVLAADDRASLYGRAEAAYAIPLVAEIGIGARVSERTTDAYVTAAVPVFPLTRLKVNVGEDLVEVGLRFSF